MTPARARQRPEPAGEPAPTPVAPSPTPVEDVPDHATPAPQPERNLADLSRLFDEGGPDALTEEERDRLFEADAAGETERLDAILDRPPTVREAVEAGVLGEGALLVAGGPDRPAGPAIAARLGLVADRTPDDDLRDDRPLSAPEALAEVMRRVPAIAKGRTADARVGGYRFRGIDDVYAALHDLFAEVGLTCLPETIDREREQRPRMSGEGVNYVTHVHVRLRFLAADGTSESLTAWGEGADTGDKSTGKAYSQAMKSALLAAFLIPTEASSNDDPDATNSAASRAFTIEEQQRAATALNAGREATTLDALAGVGRRANSGGLLDVPIAGTDGSIAPLRLHLDGLRRHLETQVRS